MSRPSTHVDPKIIAQWQVKPLVERLRDWSDTLPQPLELTEAHAQELMSEAARELEWRRSQQAPAHPFLKWFGFGLGWGLAFFGAFVVIALCNLGR